MTEPIGVLIAEDHPVFREGLMAVIEKDARMRVIAEADDTDSAVAVRAGARGYLVKSADSETIRSAIVAVARGEAVFGSSVADNLMALFAAAAGSGQAAFPQLSPREREMLDLIAQGLDNGAIASRLSLSEKTVRNAVSNILGKLQVPNRARAIVVAREAGLGGGHPLPG